MPAVSPSIPPGGEAAEMAARIASGPGFWTRWLSDLGREGLLEQLLARGVIARALREAPAGHKYDRVLNAKMTVICVLVACLFPGAGYDSVLATAFGLPGLRRPPGADVPTGPAFSQARKLLGEQVMKRLFELDAEVPDADPGTGLLWKGLEVTAIDGTTMELSRNSALEGEFGTPADGARPLPRVTAHVRTASFRWIGAAIGGYHDGENALADELEGTFRPGMLNLADRGFLSMHRWIRFSGAGADLAWRVKNGAKPVPARTLQVLPDGSELVVLRESGGMRARRRKEAPASLPGRLPDTVARLVTFTVTAVTASGKRKTTRMANRNRVPAPEEDGARAAPATARPVPGTGRQEAWALLLIHNMTAAAAARAAGTAGLDPGLIPFTAVLGLIRSHVSAGTRCQHCGGRPAGLLASLNTAILALPRQCVRADRLSQANPRGWDSCIMASGYDNPCPLDGAADRSTLRAVVQVTETLTSPVVKVRLLTRPELHLLRRRRTYCRCAREAQRGPNDG